jgi:hypothetical protein
VWNSIVLVQRWWHTVKGRNATIHPETIKNCHSKLMTTGLVKDAVRSNHPSEENVATVWEMFTCNPGKSTCRAAHASVLSRYTIHKVLKEELDFHPWRPHHVQELIPKDCNSRMEYRELMLSWDEDFPQLSENILWSDQAIFHVGGFVNRHKIHYWDAQGPNVTVEKIQNRPKVTVCCEMMATCVISPYFLRDTMNSERYLQMLQDYIWPTISGWENTDDLIFMHDGAPPHFANAICAWLNEKFPGCWLV